MKLLAIDIGSAQIKSVLFDARFNRFDIVRQETVAVAESLEPQVLLEGSPLNQNQLAALKVLWERYAGSVDRVATNLPFSLYTSRLLTFPFADRKKIRASVNFQIEDEVPFDLGDCIVTTQVFPSQNPSETLALSGVTPTAELKAYVDTLVSGAGIDPDVITTTQSATYAFLDRTPDLFANKDVAVINLGHLSSSINTYRDRIPVLHRTTMVGGFQITHAIAKSYGIGLLEAEQAKISSGFLAPPGIEQTDEQRAFSDLIGIVLEPVFHDFYQVLMAHFSRHRDRIKQIYVTGGTALLPGTCDYLAARWQVPVHPLKVGSTLANLSLKTSTNQDLILSKAIFLGLSQLEGRNRDTQNFRSGAARKEGAGFSFNLKAIERPLKVVGFVYAFVLVTMLTQNILLKSQLARKELRREAAIKSFFNSPKASAVYQLMQNPEKLKREADAKIQEVRGQYAGSLDDPSFSALGILREMSQTIPRSTVTEIRQMQLNPETAKVRLESPTADAVNAAVKALGGIRAASAISEPVRETIAPDRHAATVEIKLRKVGI